MRKLLNKLNNKHFLALAGNAVSLFGLLTWSITIKSLPSIADAGKWVFFMSVIGLCDAVRNGSLNTSTIRFYAGVDRQRGREVLGSVWVLALTITGIVLLLNAGAYFLLPYTHDNEFMVVVKWTGLTFLSSLPFNLIYWKLQAEENYFATLCLKFLNSGSTLAVFFILAVMHRMTLETALLYNFITNSVTSLVGILWGLGGFKAIVHASRRCITEIYHYGKYSLATTFSASMLGNVDNFIINFMLGPEAVAIYSIPMKLMQVIEIFLQSFVGTGMSGMAAAFNKSNMHQVTYILKKYAGMLTMGFIPLTILALLFAKPAVYVAILGSHKYMGAPMDTAANIYRLYMVLCLLYPVERFNGATLDMIHKPKINFYKVLIMLAVNIIGDVAGIAVFHNLYGIFIAAIFTHLSGMLYGYYRLNKYMHVPVLSIVQTGYAEMKLFIRQQLKLAPKE